MKRDVRTKDGDSGNCHLVAGILILLDNLATMDVIGMMRGWVGLPVFVGMASWIGLVSGVVVLFAAAMLRVRPGEATQGLRACCVWWGSLILVFSILGLFGAAMVIPWGAIFGIVGGALALSTGLRMRASVDAIGKKPNQSEPNNQTIPQPEKRC